MAQQKFTVKISKDYNPSERVALGVEIIEAIIERSQKGRDKDGNKFPKYSKGYTSSFDFKTAGKSKSKVDLTLSGEMLNSLEVLTTRPGEITIGIPKGDDFNNAKAEGNIKGSYGGKPNSEKARDFMGISENDLDKITNRFPTESGRSSNNDLLKTLLATEAARDIAENFLDIERLETIISDD